MLPRAVRAFNVSDAFMRVHKTLKKKAGTLETRDSDSPTWAPPRLRSATTENGKASFRELVFLRFKLDAHEEVEKAVDSVETFWKMSAWTALLTQPRSAPATPDPAPSTCRLQPLLISTRHHPDTTSR